MPQDAATEAARGLAGSFSGRDLFSHPILQFLASLLQRQQTPLPNPNTPPPLIASPEMLQGIPGAQPLPNPALQKRKKQNLKTSMLDPRDIIAGPFPAPRGEPRFDAQGNPAVFGAGSLFDRFGRPTGEIS